MDANPSNIRSMPPLAGAPGAYFFLPDTIEGSSDVPLLICVHGISRNAREQVTSFAPEAAQRGYALLAPHFEEAGFADYQRLGRRGRGPRADLALQNLISSFERHVSRSFGAYSLFGYSGGAQFAHRYTMAHPERVIATVCAAAGWYTHPDPRSSYPHGLRVGGALPGIQLEPRRFLEIPMLVVVGSEDIARDESLRSSARVDRIQGGTRLERAQRWVDAMREASTRAKLPPSVRYEELEGVRHSFEACMGADLATHVFDFIDDARSRCSKPDSSEEVKGAAR